jgi:hypothetical protein
MIARALASACLSLACAAPAQAGLMLHGGWQHERELETDLPASGYGAGMGIDLGACCFVGVDYSQLRTEPFQDASGSEGRLEYRTGSAQLGAVWPWTDQLGVTVAGGYAQSRTGGLDAFSEDRIERAEGPTGSLTLWLQPSSRLAFNAGRNYSYVGATPGWDSSAGVGLRLWGGLWLDGGYWRGDSAEGWTAGLRTALGGP